MSCIGGSTSLGTVPRMAWALPESADLLRAPERQALTGARATENGGPEDGMTARTKASSGMPQREAAMQHSLAVMRLEIRLHISSMG